MPKITLLLLATTIGIGITGAAFCVGGLTHLLSYR